MTEDEAIVRSFMLLVEASAQQAWYKDADCRFLAVSPAFCRDRRRDPREMIGRTEEPFFGLDRTREFRRDDELVYDARRPVEFEEWDEGRLFRTLKMPILAGDRILGTVGIASPVSPCARSADPRRQTTPSWLWKVREALEAGFDAPFSLDSLAGAVDRHPDTVSREFRKHFGITPSRFVTELRLRFAIRELTESTTPLAEIAYAAGFFDQSHFTRAFTRAHGVSPGRFRERLVTDSETAPAATPPRRSG